jgi:hypothetical protein
MERLIFKQKVYLADYHIFRCGAFFTLNNIKPYSLSLGQSFEAAGLNGAEMNKNVPAIILFDKSKTFTFVKPFDSTF